MPDYFSDNSEPLNNLLFSTANVIRGSELPEAELLTAANKKYPKRKICIPTHWIIIDILNSECSDEIPAGMHPVVVYASYTEGDVHERENSGVVSNYQITFDNCFFETNDVIYILTGIGFRQSLDFRLVKALGAT